MGALLVGGPGCWGCTAVPPMGSGLGSGVGADVGFWDGACAPGLVQASTGEKVHQAARAGEQQARIVKTQAQGLRLFPPGVESQVRKAHVAGAQGRELSSQGVNTPSPGTFLKDSAELPHCFPLHTAGLSSLPCSPGPRLLTAQEDAWLCNSRAAELYSKLVDDLVMFLQFTTISEATWEILTHRVSSGARRLAQANPGDTCWAMLAASPSIPSTQARGNFLPGTAPHHQPHGSFVDHLTVYLMHSFLLDYITNLKNS